MFQEINCDAWNNKTARDKKWYKQIKYSKSLCHNASSDKIAIKQSYYMLHFLVIVKSLKTPYSQKTRKKPIYSHRCSYRSSLIMRIKQKYFPNRM